MTSNDIKALCINETKSIKDALRKIEKNKSGLIFTLNQKKQVTGLATDGDIRRALLKNTKLHQNISSCANPEFKWVDSNTPRENILKLLDNKIHFIPVLNNSKLLEAVYSRDFLPINNEKATYVRSRAPVRISFGGGGSDLTHFFEDNNGAVINTAISIYSHATMKKRSDSKINIFSSDLDKVFRASSLESAISKKSDFGLFQAIIKTIKPEYGFDLYVNSDFPIGSGLGGSASVAAAVLGCFNMYRQDRWNQHELAELAFQSERIYLNIAGGWQDQYATVFGGFNFIEFNKKQNIVSPIRVNKNDLLELEESLILCDTGISHQSGNIHDDQKEKMKSNEIQDLVKKNVELTYEIRNNLFRGRLNEIGKSLDKAWGLKKNFGNMISNDHIDKIYSGALKNGATGGKLLGAGGGGYFVFHTSTFRKQKLVKYLTQNNLKIHPFKFDNHGLQSWLIREE
jgi:D-glycero-alpha-D-manno-heptose-7-phosphate kinase